MSTRTVASAALLALGLSPAAAFAQATPAPAPTAAPVSAPAALPSIPAGVLNSPIVQSVLNSLGGLTQSVNGNAAHGRVTYFRRFDLQIETAPRVYRQIHLHQGTMINPRGASLQPGMVVDVSGQAQNDGSLNADAITTSP